jgi:hypothetical protein
MNKLPLEEYRRLLEAIGPWGEGTHQPARAAPVVKAIYEAEDCGRTLSLAGIVMRGQYFGEVEKEEDVKKTLTIEKAHIRLMSAEEGLRDLLGVHFVFPIMGGLTTYRLSPNLNYALARTFADEKAAISAGGRR